jgi:hypothetical protein
MYTENYQCYYYESMHQSQSIHDQNTIQRAMQLRSPFFRKLITEPIEFENFIIKEMTIQKKGVETMILLSLVRDSRTRLVQISNCKVLEIGDEKSIGKILVERESMIIRLQARGQRDDFVINFDSD